MRNVVIALALAASVGCVGCTKKPPPQQPAGVAPGDNTVGGKTPSGASMDDPTPNPTTPSGKKPTSPEDPK